MENIIAEGLQSLSKLEQRNRLLRLRFPNEDGPSAVMVASRLDAREGLSRDFRFVVEVISDDATIALKDVQGKMASVEVVREDGSLRYFNGYVFEFRRDATDGAQVYYNMILVPWMSYLRLRKDNYIFQNKTLSQLTDEVFATYPVRAMELRITGSDPELTFAVQYGESDYNFLHRRWEEKGWYYWYEHSATGHTLILSDDSTQAPAIDGERGDIPFQRHAGAIEDDGIGDWTPVRKLVPSSVALSSFDFKHPRPAAVDMPTLNEQGDVLHVESYEYAGAYGFKDSSDGRAQARVRLEEIEASGKYFEGFGNDRTAQPGRKFELSGHFDEGGEGDCDFLILDAHHTASNNFQGAEGAMSSQYSNQLTCIRTKIPWRPGRGFNSSDPKIYGLQTAIVVGPAGEEIHTDEYGRVRVQFHWDRVGQFDEKSSAWLRVATPWAGANFGMTSIPRIGTEVVVQFLDGNPDRPLITAMVPNTDTMPPWALPANKTQSGILSRSTPDGTYENANAIRFEDNSGAEQLWIQAERDMECVVERNDSQSVGGDRAVSVGGSHSESIAKDLSHSVGGARTEVVKNDMTLTVTEGRKDSIVKGDITITSEAGEITMSSTTKITLVVGGSSITMTPGEITLIGTNIFLNP